MKAVVFLGDGMADEPLEALGGKTPLAVANHPHMDEIAGRGWLGRTRTVPEGFPAGSDVANLSAIGQNPADCYTGRSPLEAVSMGLSLAEDDVTYRCNLVTLSGETNFFDRTMVDYSAGEISTEEAAQLITALAAAFDTADHALFPGICYRHCLLLHHAKPGTDLTPPHDISDQKIADFLPKGGNAPQLLRMMEQSTALLARHPVNLARLAAGKPPANGIWFWGEGTRPRLSSFSERFGLSGGMISAVDLLHGIGQSMGLRSIPVEGITGNWHTDFAAKGRAAVTALATDCDFLYIHVEAPDECGHHAELREKIWSIEQIDEKIVAPVLAFLRESGEDYRVLLLPDHPTPIARRTHTADPVPFAVLTRERDVPGKPPRHYDEATALTTGLFVPEAHTILPQLLGSPRERSH